jgi:hypothetical protein
MTDAVTDNAPSDARARIAELIERMGDAIIGQQQVIERLVIGLLANGNLLVEGPPGLAKTRARSTPDRSSCFVASRGRIRSAAAHPGARRSAKVEVFSV